MGDRGGLKGGGLWVSPQGRILARRRMERQEGSSRGAGNTRRRFGNSDSCLRRELVGFVSCEEESAYRRGCTVRGS
jgi:hypothetical protein